LGGLAASNSKNQNFMPTLNVAPWVLVPCLS
jgi:hypothetical protein